MSWIKNITKGEWELRFFNSSQEDDGESDFFIEAPQTRADIGHNIEILGDDYGDHNGYPREQRLADAKLTVLAGNLAQKYNIEALPQIFRALQAAYAHYCLGLKVTNGTPEPLSENQIEEFIESALDAGILENNGFDKLKELQMIDNAISRIEIMISNEEEHLEFLIENNADQNIIENSKILLSSFRDTLKKFKKNE